MTDRRLARCYGVINIKPFKDSFQAALIPFEPRLLTFYAIEKTKRKARRTVRAYLRNSGWKP